MKAMLCRAAVASMRLLAPWPLPWLRAAGRAFGIVLWHLARSRREVVRTNLALCMPQLDLVQREALARAVFVAFAQSWLDRSWLWHAPVARVRERLQLVGDLSCLQGDRPVVLFAPHFFGLDAAWTALTLNGARRWCTIYSHQNSKEVDAWILRGRERFGSPRLFGRHDGMRRIVASLREGGALYLLPDMDLGADDSLFVPFFGVPAATVPSLSRFARLGDAAVVPVLARMTPTGYEVRLLPAWKDFPSDDLQADTLRMNRELEQWVREMPAQYYWVHRRFKSRPAGEPSPYGD